MMEHRRSDARWANGARSMPSLRVVAAATGSPTSVTGRKERDWGAPAGRQKFLQLPGEESKACFGRRVRSAGGWSVCRCYKLTGSSSQNAAFLAAPVFVFLDSPARSVSKGLSVALH